MIIRLVKMEFSNDQRNKFENLFNERKEKIEGQEGCHSVRLFNDLKDNNVYFTYSVWDSENHLNQYRHSEFFKDTWAKTKSLFNEKPKAWSVVETKFA